MKIKKFPAIILTCLAFSCTAFAQQIQSFDLTWSGTTPLLKSLAALSLSSGNLGNDAVGCPYVSSASATGKIQVDMSQVPAGTFAIPASAIVSFTIVVSNAGSGSGTFSISNQDFQSLSIDVGGGSFDFSKELVGQLLPNNTSWGAAADVKAPALAGDFSLSAADGSMAPCGSSFPFVVVTGGSNATDGVYLQLVSMKPSP